MSSGQSVVRRPLFSKSNIELINSLRANFTSFQHHSSSSTTTSTTESSWAASPAPVFTTPSGQPITTSVTVASGSTSAGANTLMISFGSGMPLART